MTNYIDFLAKKKVSVPAVGFEVDASDLNPILFDWQRHVVAWALKLGRAALFEECGLGKTFQQLEWANQVHQATGGDVLILAPLAVNKQTVAEGLKLGLEVTSCRSQADVQDGINIANYEMLEHFDCSSFSGVVLDESSILKSYMGKTKQRLMEAFKDTPFRLCCTATPAPNDYLEIGNHAEFLGIMPANEMIMRWFINDTMNFGNYRLKGHAEKDFWAWVGSWAASLRKPSDLGYLDEGYLLPELNLHQERVEVDQTDDKGEALFRAPVMSATTMHDEMKKTCEDRAKRAAELVNNSSESWAVWCNSNYEADALVRLIPDAIEVRGNDSVKDKESKLEAFSSGAARVIITKPTIAGFGLNWQHCANAVFVGLSYSFEQLYQAMRRIYRFGQLRPVNIHIVTATTEGAILQTIHAKMDAHEKLMDSLSSNLAGLQDAQRRELKLEAPSSIHQGDGHTLYHGDCVEVAAKLESDSIHFSIYSPPFANLYIYSDSVRDMGNCSNDDEFFAQYQFLIKEIYRITKPGRLSAVHCKNLVNYKGRDGMAGMRDFRGEIIRQHLEAGFAYHSEVTIWKDPVIEMQRTKAHGLLYKQLRKDSSFSRQGMAEYLLIFRKWADEDGSGVEPVTHTKDDFPLDVWQRYASPVWMDIQQTNVLNGQVARENQDEKHICPLQLDVIERAIELWTNPGDVVFTPFLGIGSEIYQALKMGRQGKGVELKEAYWKQAIKFCSQALEAKKQTSLFPAAE